jgi:hypothetical protein
MAKQRLEISKTSRRDKTPNLRKNMEDKSRMGETAKVTELQQMLSSVMAGTVLKKNVDKETTRMVIQSTSSLNIK